MQKEVVVSVRHLVKAFGRKTKVEAVRGISFELHRGEVLGILGPNGAGKTTTIRMLLTALTPTSGEIKYFGLDLSKHRSEILQRVGFGSTYTSLPYFLTVEQNLHVHGLLYGLEKGERERRMTELLDVFGATGLLKKRMTQLSAGEKTRVMLVKCFMPSPEVVLLDEPTASLDPDIAQQVRDFIVTQRTTQNVSVIFTSHNMNEVSRLCDRVVFLRKGEILDTDTPEVLAKKIGESRLDLFVADGLAILRRLLEERRLPFEEQGRAVSVAIDEPLIPQFLADLPEQGVSLSHLAIRQPTLEDFFLRYSQ